MTAVEASVFIENLSTVRSYNVSPALTAPAVRIPVRPQEVWLDYASIPTTPPAQTAWPGTASGPVTGLSGIAMTAVSGSTTDFESTLGRFGYIIPGSHNTSAYAYNPTLTDSLGAVVPYNPSVWVADGLLGKISFTFGVPAGVVPPFTLKYWRYTGEFVAGGDGSTLASTGGTESLVADGIGPTLAIRGLTAGAGVSLTGVVGNDITIAATTALSSAGGTTLVKSGGGPALVVKGLTAGVGVSLSGGTDEVTITNSSPASGVTLDSAGGVVTLVSDGTGPALAVLGLTAGTGVSLSSSGTAVTVASTVTVASAGGSVSLVNTGAAPAYTVKGLTAGVGISLASDSTTATVTNSSPASSVTLTSAGGTLSLVKTGGGTGPDLVARGLTVGFGVALTGDTNDITVATTHSIVSAGGTTLLKDGVGPAFLTKGLTAGTGISLTGGTNDVTVALTTASLTLGSTAVALGATAASIAGLTALGATTITGTTGSFGSTLDCAAMTASGLVTANGGFTGTSATLSTTLSVTGTATMTSPMIVGVSSNVGVTVAPAGPGSSGSIFGSYGSGPYLGSGIGFATDTIIPTDKAGAPTNGTTSLGGVGVTWGAFYATSGTYTSTVTTTGSMITGPSADVGVTVAPAASNASGCIFGSFGTPGLYVGSGIGFASSKVIPTDRAGAPTNGTTSLGAALATWGPLYATTGTFSSTLGCTALTATTGSFSSTLGATGLSTLTGGLVVGPSANVGIATVVPTSSASGGIYGSFGTGPYSGSGINFAASVVLPTDNAGTPMTDGSISLGASGYRWGGIYGVTGNYSSTLATTGSVVVGPSADVGVTVAPAASNASGSIFGSYGAGPYTGSGIGFATSKVIPTDRAGAPTNGTTSLGGAGATWGPFYATTGTFSSTLGVTGVSTLTGGLLVGPSADVGVTITVPTSSASGGIYGSFGAGPYLGSGINFASSAVIPTTLAGVATNGTTTLGAANGYSWGTLYSTTGLFSTSVAAGPNTSTSTLSATVHRSTATTGYVIATTNTFCGTGTWDGSSGSSCGPGFGGDITTGNSFIQACTLAGASPTFASASLSLQPNGQTTIVGGVLSVVGTVSAPSYTLSYSALGTPPTSSQIGWSASVGSFTSPVIAGTTLLPLAKHTGVGVGVYIVSFLAVLGGTSGGSGKFDFLLQAETSGAVAVATAGPYILCFDQLTFVSADSMSGTWTYANNTANASIGVYVSSTAAVDVVCSATSFIQLTRIA